MNPNYLSSQNMMNMQNMMNNPVMMSMFIQWMNNQNMQGMNMDMNMMMSNQIMMNMFYQWLNSQNINQNQNQNNTFINNQQPQSNQNNNIGAINLMFSKDMKNYPIVTNYNESLGTVIGKYINLTKDYNINMHRVQAESWQVSRLGPHRRHLGHEERENGRQTDQPQCVSSRLHLRRAGRQGSLVSGSPFSPGRKAGQVCG